MVRQMMGSGAVALVAITGFFARHELAFAFLRPSVRLRGSRAVVDNCRTRRSRITVQLAAAGQGQSVPLQVSQRGCLHCEGVKSCSFIAAFTCWRRRDIMFEHLIWSVRLRRNGAEVILVHRQRRRRKARPSSCEHYSIARAYGPSLPRQRSRLLA